MIFNYVLILTHYVKTFGFIITKQAGEIILAYVNGYIKNYIGTFDIFHKILIEDF